MLSRAHRVASATDFRTIVRKGRRLGTPNAVLYVLAQQTPGPTRVGFIVAKSVGNSVTRSFAARRLRAVGLDFVRSQPTGVDVVIRALPASSVVSWATLQSEILSGLERSTAQ